MMSCQGWGLLTLYSLIASLSKWLFLQKYLLNIAHIPMELLMELKVYALLVIQANSICLILYIFQKW